MTDEHDLLTPKEVGELFRVDPRTVTKWATDGKLPFVMTLGNHRRYPRKLIEGIIAEEQRKMQERLAAFEAKS